MNENEHISYNEYQDKYVNKNESEDIEVLDENTPNESVGCEPVQMIHDDSTSNNEVAQLTRQLEWYEDIINTFVKLVNK